MLGTNKPAVLFAWALTVAAAFAIGRSTAPAGSDPASEMAPENLATAIEAALGEPDVLERAKRTVRLLQYLDPENVTEVAAVYDLRLNMLGDLAIRPFVAAWARFDPAAALKHTLLWRYRDKKEVGVGTAIEAWALRDPDAALEAFNRAVKRNPNLQDMLFFDLLTGWLYSGQGGVEDYIANLPTEGINSAVSRVAAKILRKDGVEALIRWVDSTLDNNDYGAQFRKKTFQRGSRMIARWDPERAAAWVMEHRGHKYTDDGPRIVAEQWGSQDGPAAVEWVRNYPDEEPRELAAREAFRTWFESDRAAAVEWLESESLTAFHEPAILYYAQEIGHKAPAEAVGWCERVHVEKRRLGCLKTAATLWYRRDALAAETWLQQSPLDEEARNAVRTPPKKRQQRGQTRKGAPSRPK
jgi:hypothetical protein